MTMQDQFGTGIQLSPKWPWGYLLGGKEDFVFGIFGRSNYARATLARRWASARRLLVCLEFRGVRQADCCSSQRWTPDKHHCHTAQYDPSLMCCQASWS